jgi:hypothetical protein
MLVSSVSHSLKNDCLFCPHFSSPDAKIAVPYRVRGVVQLASSTGDFNLNVSLDESDCFVVVRGLVCTTDKSGDDFEVFV